MSEHSATVAHQIWRRPMVARRTDEEHRASTVLELFFDLCFVVAVAQAAGELHHLVSGDHVADGVVAYFLVFFAVWWAWMNFTWFASAYDTDDVAYRVTTLVQIAGALVFAAGVPRAMDHRDFAVTTLGYVIMRLAMVTQWLRAAHADRVHRQACVRFAAGVTLVQIGWVVRLALPGPWDMVVFGVLVVAELGVPIFAERASHTSWHPRHIAERYGLFTLIVLGESVAAATVAIQKALDDDISLSDVATVATGGILTVFAMWWLYFAKDAARLLTSSVWAFVWGYGHYFVFGSAAAVGAGLEISIDHASGETHIGATAAAACFTVPVAVFLLAMWVLHWSPLHGGRWVQSLAPGFAAAVLLATFSPEPVLVTGLLVAALVAATRQSRPAARPSECDGSAPAEQEDAGCSQAQRQSPWSSADCPSCAPDRTWSASKDSAGPGSQPSSFACTGTSRSMSTRLVICVKPASTPEARTTTAGYPGGQPQRTSTSEQNNPPTRQTSWSTAIDRAWSAISGCRTSSVPAPKDARSPAPGRSPTHAPPTRQP
jgi:low temperature requirement protein LtrA